LIGTLERALSQQAHLANEDHARLSAVTDRLHDQIRRTRMLPVATIFGPLRLQAREMARAADRQVALVLDDGGAEADRQVLDNLRDVLTHLLRNAIDHGIQLAAQRATLGKPTVGRIELRATVSGDRLSLTIEDDGEGLDLGAIRQRALVTGVSGDADLARMGDDEVADLIFLPGLSTRQTVSTLSGRGVGLDIVRSRVERMHGRVSVQSTPGSGTRFTISVPLSLTSSHGLLLRAAGATYVVPLESVQRIVPVSIRDVRVIEGRAAITLDERPVVLVRLAELLGLADRRTTTEERGATRAAASGTSMALLLGSGDRTVACLVDTVLSEQELVVYRLPAPLQRVRFIAGATILADGSVVPLIDVVDILRAATNARQMIAQPAEEAEGPRRTPTVLVADDSITTRTLEKNILESAGYKVRLATDGVEALQILRQLSEDGGCDLLLSDVDMPRLNGFDLTAQVRSDARLQHTPVVLVTSLDTPADRERGIAAGADAYIVKRAFDQQTLLDTIAGLV
jgi:two-component system chemotaxis sensor kinase CheA